jgi:hypothetical protein
VTGLVSDAQRILVGDLVAAAGERNRFGCIRSGGDHLRPITNRTVCHPAARESLGGQDLSGTQVVGKSINNKTV